MKKLLIWPGIFISPYLLLQIYQLFKPCDSGMFIGGCGMGDLFMKIIMGIMLATYFLMAGIYLVICKFKKSKPDLKIFIILGLLSIVIFFLLFIFEHMFLTDIMGWVLVLIGVT